MKIKFKKGFAFICFFAILLVTLISACGKKAPPKPPVEKSGEQTPNALEKNNFFNFLGAVK
jgi:predicted small lipoprotein YifL